jgi:hypothetical protein
VALEKLGDMPPQGAPAARSLELGDRDSGGGRRYGRRRRPRSARGPRRGLPRPPLSALPTVVSPRGFVRRIAVCLNPCEVRKLPDVGDEGRGEERGEVFDELGRKRAAMTLIW